MLQDMVCLFVDPPRYNPGKKKRKRCCLKPMLSVYSATRVGELFLGISLVLLYEAIGICILRRGDLNKGHALSELLG